MTQADSNVKTKDATAPSMVGLGGAKFARITLQANTPPTTNGPKRA